MNFGIGRKAANPRDLRFCQYDHAAFCRELCSNVTDSALPYGLDFVEEYFRRHGTGILNTVKWSATNTSSSRIAQHDTFALLGFWRRSII